MKYVIVLCDGMADMPFEALGKKTPMELAKKSVMDRLAALGEVGMARTIPRGMPAGSDVANLTVMGYDTRECYTGRSPLEAANLGIELGGNDIAFRCNLVTLSDSEDYRNKTMVDYCAGDIHTDEAGIIIKDIQSALGGGEFDFYTGTAYRHCMIWHGGKAAHIKLTPPHDISGKRINEYLPRCDDALPLLEIMRRSCDLLKDHPVNLKRIASGLSPANAVWLWGQGGRPRLEQYKERFNVDGAVVSAVDLIKGIARLTGLHVCEVEGATGYIDTNYEGKTAAALEQLSKGRDFVYIHIEAPDECGHRGQAQNKIKAIEDIESRVLKPLIQGLETLKEPYRLLILPDHPTPLSTRTHSDLPVPYLLYPADNSSGIDGFTEAAAQKTGIFIEQGHTLINRLFEKRAD